jgi:hypothetical protein
VQEDAHVGCLGVFLFVFLNKEPAVLAEKKLKCRRRADMKATINGKMNKKRGQVVKQERI